MSKKNDDSVPTEYISQNETTDSKEIQLPIDKPEKEIKNKTEINKDLLEISKPRRYIIRGKILNE